MAKHNVVKAAKRAEKQERKRAIRGEPGTGKLRQNKHGNSIPISGKRKRKLFKKWRREQKEALQKGLVTMEDVEMAVAEGASTSQGDTIKSHMKFPLKRGNRLRIKKLKGKGKSGRAHTKPAVTVAPADAMQE